MTYIEDEEIISIQYPPAPDDIECDNPEIIWDVMENYVATRWSTAEVQFTVHSPCRNNWRPPYRPFTIEFVDGDAAEVNQFGEVTLEPGRHSVTCTIGGQPVTAGVETAFSRLFAYYQDVTNRSGYARYSVNLGGDLSESWSRLKGNSAIGNSGAAELLRKYRKAGIAHV